MKNYLPLILSMAFIACEPSSPAFDDISLIWELETNMYEGKGECRTSFLFVNQGNSTLKGKGWALFFNQVTRMPRAESMPPEAVVEHLNGDFYRLIPTEAFILAPGDSLKISYTQSDFITKISDAPNGLYFGELDNDGKVVSTHLVKNYHVSPFQRTEQIQRLSIDQTPIPTPEWQYKQNQKMSLVSDQELLPIIPPPAKLKMEAGRVALDASFTIQYADGLLQEANHLAEALEDLMGTRLPVNPGESESPKTLRLKLSPSLADKAESYQLTIDPNTKFEIIGTDPAGVFYGIQSLLALAPITAYREEQNRLDFPSLSIEDGPRFGYRGFMLDVGRNFHSLEAVRKVLDIAAFYKLNVMQILLSEDEGWRIEIPGLPELTEVGSKRGHAMPSDPALHPAYGSGPVGDRNISAGSGFYTREEYIDLIKYAKARHIRLIPTINFPGHARAAIKSMQARYETYMKSGDPKAAEEYLLHDPEDTSTYLSAQYYKDNVVCVCRESVYTFYEKVVDEITLMYKEAGAELPIFHTGGDEVPAGPWEGSPICQAFMKDHPEVAEAKYLNDYFHRRIGKQLADRNIQMAGWEEMILWRNSDGSQSINPEFLPIQPLSYVWNNLWNAKDLGHRMANAGYPVILCNVTNFYFDLAYNKDPKETGLYWGGYVNTRSSFEFHPYNVFLSTKTDNMGATMDPDKDFDGLEVLKPENRKYVKGLQAQLWSETIQEDEKLESYYFPKLLGFARSAWAVPAEWESQMDHEKRNATIDHDWNLYANTIARRDLSRLSHQFGGYTYRIAPPGAIIEEGMLKANTEFPGLAIRYSIDGSEPTMESPLYEGPVEVNGVVKLRTFNEAGRGSRVVSVGKYKD